MHGSVLHLCSQTHQLLKELSKTGAEGSLRGLLKPFCLLLATLLCVVRRDRQLPPLRPVKPESVAICSFSM